MKNQFMVLVAAVLVLAGCRQHKDSYEATLPSPDFNIHLYFNLFNGIPYYRVYCGKDKLLGWSVLGFRPKDGTDLTTGMVLAGGSDATGPWNEGPPVGILSDVNYNSLSVPLASTRSDMAYTIDFMCFNAGVAFRYRFESPALLNALRPAEVSEIDFDPSLGNCRDVRSQDTLSVETSGKLALPLQLEFDRGKKVTILSSDMEEPFAVVRIEDEEEGHHFRVRAMDNVTTENVNGDAQVTPWRFLIIHKSNPDE